MDADLAFQGGTLTRLETPSQNASHWAPALDDGRLEPAAQGSFLLAVLQSAQLVPGIPAAAPEEASRQLQVAGSFPMHVIYAGCCRSQI